MAKKKRDPIKLPEKDRTPLRKYEFDSMIKMFSLLGDSMDTLDNLKNRLKIIPKADFRLNMAISLLRSTLQDISGTIPTKQLMKLKNVGKEMDFRLVPTLAPLPNKAIFDLDDFRTIVDYSRTGECSMCVRLTKEERAECPLFQTLCAIAPMDFYDDDGRTCSYAVAQWKSKMEEEK